MKNDPTIDGLLDDELKDDWQLIKDNQIEALLLKLPVAKKTLWSGLFKPAKESQANEQLYTILYSLFTKNKSKVLDNAVFSVMNQQSLELFRNLVKLLFAVAINGNYKHVEGRISDKLLHSTSVLSGEVEKKSNNYPLNSINGQVWMGGAFLRSSFEYLAYYHGKNGALNYELAVQKQRTWITLKIMSHYQHLVFPDMLRVAALEERFGEKEKALSRYEAVIADFEADNMLGDLLDDADEVPGEELHEAYKAVIMAYESRNRLEDMHRNDDTIVALKAVLAR